MNYIEKFEIVNQKFLKITYADRIPEIIDLEKLFPGKMVFKPRDNKGRFVKR